VRLAPGGLLPFAKQVRLVPRCLWKGLACGFAGQATRREFTGSPFGSSLDCGEEAGRIGFHVDGRWAGRKKGRLARMP
jgi:hypothetical protein